MERASFSRRDLRVGATMNGVTPIILDRVGAHVVGLRRHPAGHLAFVEIDQEFTDAFEILDCGFRETSEAVEVVVGVLNANAARFGAWYDDRARMLRAAA